MNLLAIIASSTQETLGRSGSITPRRRLTRLHGRHRSPSKVPYKSVNDGSASFCNASLGFALGDARQNAPERSERCGAVPATQLARVFAIAAEVAKRFLIALFGETS